MANPTAAFPAAIHTPTDVSAFSGAALGSTSPSQTQLAGKVEQEIYEIERKLGIGSALAASASTGQVLTKKNDGTTGWVTPAAGGGGGGGGGTDPTANYDWTGVQTFEQGNLLDKGSMVFDVKAYGAVGDGVADDSTAILAAIAAIQSVYNVLAVAATLYFPHGVFRTTVSIAGISHLHIRGAGRGASTLLKDFSGGVLLDISGTGTSNDGSTHIREVSVRDIKLEGNSTTGTVLRTYFASEIYFENVMFVGGGGSGLDAVELFDSYFAQCAFEDFFSTTQPVIYIRSSAATSGFANGVDSSNMVWFTQCRIESFKSTAIKIEKGVGAGVQGAPNGFQFHQFKIECSNVRGTLIDISDTATMNVVIQGLYLYAGAFDSGYATPIDMIKVGAHALVSLRDIFLASADGIVSHGINLSSADGAVTVDNVHYDGTPGTSTVHVSGGAEVRYGIIECSDTGKPLFTGNDRTSYHQTAGLYHNKDATNNPTGFKVVNDGDGADFEAENTANDANLNARTTGVSKAAFINLYATADAYNAFNGFVNDVLKWRAGRSGDNNGFSIYTLDGATRAVWFKDDQSTSFYGKMGYGTGTGSTVTQLTNKSTGVTLNKVTGQITLNGAALAAATSVGFTLTNSQITATDVIIVNIASGATAASYTVTVDAVAAGSCRIHLRNESAASKSEALVLNFVVIKGANA